LVRRYAATSSTRSGRSNAHCCPGRPVGDLVATALGDDPDQPPDLGGL
jgi:hypothetical protein